MAELDMESAELLGLFKGLRVSDVRDGLDWNMMHGYGSMSPDIRPVFRTRTCGIAKTVRYLPYEGNVPRMTPEEYTEWSAWYYNNVCTYPWLESIRKGDFIVIDQSGIDSGLMGSNNSLMGFELGARGFVSNGGVRDTDEIILEKVPFWSRFISQSMVQGRLRFEAQDIPVNCGGVAVCPGDIVVADGDGVIVVPRRLARETAEYGRKELEADKVLRRMMYDEMGMKLDESVL